MTRIADLELLVCTAELGSLTAAARALDWSPAAASAAVKRLEASWGVPVFVRTTRSLRLSAQGERLLPAVQRALVALQEARAAATATGRHGARAALRGDIHLTAPSDLGRSVLLPWLEEFQALHPALALRLHLSDRNADLLRTPVDLAIRYGAPRGPGQVALPLVRANRRVLVASPAYLARHGVPGTTEALAAHEALRYMLGDRVPATWRLQVGGQWHSVPVQGRRTSNDGEVVRRWARAGLGVAFKSWLDVASDVEAGLLQLVNPHWRGEDVPLYLVAPGRGQLTPAARALRDHLVQRFEPLAARLPPG
jgi:DNA-binding transcriptional LysR family regulator